jgi:hypothetical protein
MVTTGWGLDESQTPQRSLHAAPLLQTGRPCIERQVTHTDGLRSVVVEGFAS